MQKSSEALPQAKESLTDLRYEKFLLAKGLEMLAAYRAIRQPERRHPIRDFIRAELASQVEDDAVSGVWSCGQFELDRIESD